MAPELPGANGTGEERPWTSKRDGFGRPERSLPERKLSRARFLRLVGAGVGLSFVPGSLAASFGGGAAGAQTAGAPTLLAGDTYPIGLWWPPPPTETTTQRYQEIAAAGFNFVIGGNGITNDTYNPTALQAAGANNLRYVLRDSKLTKIIRDSAAYSDPKAEVRLRIDQLLKRYGGYPALAGLYLYDEPKRDLFGILGYAREYLRTKNSKQLPWANLYPYTSDQSLLGTSTYEEYLRLYLGEVKPPFLSFDHYPLLSGTEITNSYFHNWAQIRRFSLEAGVPSWVFIQSVDFDWEYADRRRPNEAELFWQVNVSLAYGAKGIQYFTYWTPSGNSTTQFGEALVSKDGRLTPLYDYAKRVNGYLKVVGKALLPLASESVVHAAESPLPSGATAFSADGYVESVGGSPVIVGRFRKPSVENERHLLVANRSFANTAQPQLKTSPLVREVLKLDSGTGTFARVGSPEYENGTLKPSIAAGRAALYLLRK